MQNEERQREELAEQLYDKRPRQYADLRRYSTEAAMQKRLATVAAMKTAVPVQKRTSDNARWMRLCWESLMLRWKRQLYVARRDTEPAIITLLRTQLELTDRADGGDQDVKREHASLLIFIVLRVKPVGFIEAQLAAEQEAVPSLR